MLHTCQQHSIAGNNNFEKNSARSASLLAWRHILLAKGGQTLKKILYKNKVRWFTIVLFKTAKVQANSSVFCEEVFAFPLRNSGACSILISKLCKLYIQVSGQQHWQSRQVEGLISNLTHAKLKISSLPAKNYLTIESYLVPQVSKAVQAQMLDGLEYFLVTLYVLHENQNWIHVLLLIEQVFCQKIQQTTN